MSIEVEYESQTENLTDEFYSNFIDPDRLMEKWILFSTPVPISILLLYFLFVLKLGPMYMKNRSPYKLKTVMRIYNIVQIIYNSSIVYNFLVPQVGVMPLPFLTRISCSIPKPFEGCDYLKSLYIYGGWHFQMLKILDLLDTVFMVLRKKDSHITFLHVYHHAAMVFFPWFSLRFIKAPQGSLLVFINLIVHAIMYTYYFLTTFHAFKKYLWWKHHLTKLQLLQFVVILVYISLLYYNECPISRSFSYIWLFNVFFILCLFLNFYIKSYIVKEPDSITQSWTLFQSPLPVFISLVVYLMFVLHIGPKLMASKKPYNISTLMRVYNVIQIVYNAYALSQLFVTPRAIRYLLEHSCHLDDPDNVKDLRQSFLYWSWHYFVMKLLDLFDTVFMVLRKKNSHISFLHIYHHTAMVFFTWYSNKYIKAQQATIPAFINLVVHCIMYLYYFLATFGPEMQRYLWWKKYLTTLQLGQFVVVIMYLWLLYHFDCEVSQAFNAIWIINVTVIAAFFVNFYIQTYVIKPRSDQRCNEKSE